MVRGINIRAPSSALTPAPPQAPLFKVAVTGLTATTTDGEVSEFFSFCGIVKYAQVKDEADGSRSAVVAFDDEAAVQTALLLSGAVIQGESISVAVAVGSAEPADSPAPGAKTATAVFREMAAKGYQSVVNLSNRAVVFDKTKSLAAALKAAIIEVGRVVASTAKAGGRKLQAFSEKHHLKDKAESAGRSIAGGAKKAGAATKERATTAGKPAGAEAPAAE